MVVFHVSTFILLLRSACVKIKVTCQSQIKTHEEDLSMKKEAIDLSSLAHTKWNCKYHIVFALNIDDK